MTGTPAVQAAVDELAALTASLTPEQALTAALAVSLPILRFGAATQGVPMCMVSALVLLVDRASVGSQVDDTRAPEVAAAWTRFINAHIMEAKQ